MKLITTLSMPDAAPCAAALGYFDGVHLGHQAVLAAACAQPGLMPLAFTFSLKEDGKRPAQKKAGQLDSDSKRAERLFAYGMETVLMPDFSEISEMRDSEFVDLLCRRVGARAVFCGEDYRFSCGASAGIERLRELCAAYGVPVTAVPPVEVDGLRVSSTRIRALLQEGDAAQAAKLLGHPYELDASVEKGQQLGRKLGFPTINQPFFSGAAMPMYGVYASRVHVGEKIFPGVTSVGVRPTVGENLSPRAETYLIGFSGDLYGCRVRVEFLRFLRGEIRFPSLDALQAQIAGDAEKAKEIFESGARQI